MNRIKLSFHGAAKDVTGSCHLLEVNDTRILVDCGLFQGPRSVTEANRETFGFEPAEIDYVLLTHAHLDHCGRLPLLYRHGFRGEIITTSASRDLAKLVLLDAARLQEEDSERAKKHARRSGNNDLEPLYDVDITLCTFDHFGRTARYEQEIDLGKGIRVRYIDAGHILGSASLVIDIDLDGTTRTLVFSGDIGNDGRPLLRDPTPPPQCDYVIMETTYGDRDHKNLEASVEELYEVIHETMDRGGNVIIPTFALERAQEVLYYIREGIENGRLPHYLPVFLDSPMAISATEIFRRHPECLKRELGEEDPFQFKSLRFTRETRDSMALNNIEGGAVILAGSGMCSGGRVVHHLKHNLWRRESSIMLVGYASPGTLARKLVDGAEQVRMFGQDVKVRAKIHTINGFSAHADRTELLKWHGSTGKPRNTILVHGDYDRGMQAFADTLEKKGFKTAMPGMHEALLLD